MAASQGKSWQNWLAVDETKFLQDLWVVLFEIFRTD